MSFVMHVDVSGAPWFTRMLATLQYPDRVIMFKHRGRDVIIHANDKGNTIPLISHESFGKAVKKSIFVYIIFVKDSMSTNEQLSPLTYPLSKEELLNKAFLDDYASLFINSILGDLPPSCGDDDHRIEILLGSSPPNKRPYRIYYAQQKEIMA